MVRALVLDGASPLTEEDKAALFGLAPQLIILSKGDLAPVLTADEVRAAFGDVPTVAVCAPRGEGMEALKEALAAFVPGGWRGILGVVSGRAMWRRPGVRARRSPMRWLRFRTACRWMSRRSISLPRSTRWAKSRAKR